MRFLSIVKSAENQGPPPQALLDAIRSEEHTSELQSLAYLVCRLLLEKKTCALPIRSEEHTSELQSLAYLVCRLLLEKKKPDTTLGPEHITIQNQQHTPTNVLSQLRSN